VWLFPLVDETQGVQVKLWYPFTIRAIPQSLRDVLCFGALQIDITFTFIKRAADNPYCNHCQGAYETAAHFVGECDRFASLRWEIWGKPNLHPDDFQHVTVGELMSFIRKSRIFPEIAVLALLSASLHVSVKSLVSKRVLDQNSV